MGIDKCKNMQCCHYNQLNGHAQHQNFVCPFIVCRHVHVMGSALLRNIKLHNSKLLPIEGIMFYISSLELQTFCSLNNYYLSYTPY
jgi:hypothetical protein